MYRGGSFGIVVEASARTFPVKAFCTKEGDGTAGKEGDATPEPSCGKTCVGGGDLGDGGAFGGAGDFGERVAMRPSLANGTGCKPQVGLGVRSSPCDCAWVSGSATSTGSPGKLEILAAAAGQGATS